MFLTMVISVKSSLVIGLLLLPMWVLAQSQDLTVQNVCMEHLALFESQTELATTNEIIKYYNCASVDSELSFTSIDCWADTVIMKRLFQVLAKSKYSQMLLDGKNNPWTKYFSMTNEQKLAQYKITLPLAVAAKKAFFNEKNSAQKKRLLAGIFKFTKRELRYIASDLDPEHCPFLR